MSAVPRPRSVRDRAAPRRVPALEIPDTPAEFYGQVPAGPIADKTLSDREARVFTALCILARGSRTWVRATIAEVMLASGKTERVARVALRELTSSGRIEWDSIGDQFRVLFRLRGRADGPSDPAPRLAPAPVCVPDPVPDPAPVSVPICVAGPAPHTPVLVLRERDEKNDDERADSTSLEITEGIVHEPDECVDQVTEDELHDAIAGRVIDLFGAVNRVWLSGDIREHGEAAVEHALTICEEMPSPPRTYAYVRGILRKQQEEAVEHGRRKTRSERHARPYYQAGDQEEKPARMERGDLAEAIEMARGGDRVVANFARSILRGMIATGEVAADQLPADILADQPPPGEKNPAAGPLGKVPPPPVSEHPMPPPSSYREQEFTASDEAEPRMTQQAPGGSDPVPPPTGGAPPARTHAAGPGAGGRREAPADRIGRGRHPAPPSGPAIAGARPIGTAGAPADRPPVPRCAPPSGRYSDGPVRLGQRLSDGPPEPRRRE